MLKNIFFSFTMLAVPFISSAFSGTKEASAAIQWEKGFDEAIAKSKATGKPILLDVFMIGWASCESLDTVTYPQPVVIDYINKNFIPVRYNIQTNPDIKNKYRLLWAPTVIILDSDGTDYHRFNGFLPPDEFIPQLEFGIAKMALEKRDLKTARMQFTSVVEKYPKSDIAPEAQYWVGVVDFQITNDVNAEIQAWEKIIKSYPNSIWARKVSGSIPCEKE